MCNPYSLSDILLITILLLALSQERLDSQLKKIPAFCETPSFIAWINPACILPEAGKAHLVKRRPAE
jgi:hypothetical protein